MRFGFIGLLVCLFLGVGPSLQAQQSSTDGSNADGEETDLQKDGFGKRLEYGVNGGTFLPNDIFGVRDQYSGWGFRVGHPYRVWRLEWSGYLMNSKGVQWYTGSLSIGGDIDFNDIIFMAYLGLDLHYYSGRTAIRHVPFETVQGGHIGFSPIVPVSEGTLFRVDFKMNFNPGTSLYVGVGFAFWAGAAAKEDGSTTAALSY